MVDARDQDIAAAAKDLRCAVAVVNVPVDDQDPADPELAMLLNRQKPIARSAVA